MIISRLCGEARTGIIALNNKRRRALSGAFAFGGANVQAERLMADGVEVEDGKVDLTRYGIK